MAKEPAKKAARKNPGQMNLDVSASRQFTSWLREQGVSLAFTTYQSGKLFLIGSSNDGRLTVYNRNFQRIMGLNQSRPGTLWMTTLYQIWRLENMMQPGQTETPAQGGSPYDSLFVPQLSFVTGDVDAHDIALEGPGRPIFINTMFSCIARPSATHSFEPVWKPPFVSRLAAEDRCHLNGLAMDGFTPAYVTAIATTDVHGGWREHRRDGGVVVDVQTNEIVCTGLSMPHSPRVHNGELYVLNSGAGYFGRVDRQAGKFEPIAFCPGYARGMSFVGNFAVIGLSRCRENRTFSGLALDDELDSKKIEARSGVQIIDLRTGDSVHNLEIGGDVRELYDTAVLQGTLAPSAVGFMSDEIRRAISIAPVRGVYEGPRQPLSEGGATVQPGVSQPVADAGATAPDAAPSDSGAGGDAEAAPAAKKKAAKKAAKKKAAKASDGPDPVADGEAELELSDAGDSKKKDADASGD